MTVKTSYLLNYESKDQRKQMNINALEADMTVKEFILFRCGVSVSESAVEEDKYSESVVPEGREGFKKGKTVDISKVKSGSMDKSKSVFF